MTQNYYFPIYLKNYNIYDIFYNDINQLVIISPMEKSPLTISLCCNNIIFPFVLETCPHNHTYVYHCKIDKFEPTVQLLINDDSIYTKVNKYLNLSNEIIMSTIVKNEDKYIRQWINYHFALGITRFIIYDNSDLNTLQDTLRDFMETNVVLLIHWNYPYILERSGISGQTTQQNHSLYAFRNSKYICLFDIDEYINPQTDCFKIDDCLKIIIKDNNLDINKLGAFRILNKFFYNPNHMPTDGYNFLKIFNCNKLTINGHEKNIIIPQNVKMVSVHVITIGKLAFTTSDKYVYFNHYFFLNKEKRGQNRSNRIDKSITNVLHKIKIDFYPI